jgi:hypothetical protein
MNGLRRPSLFLLTALAVLCGGVLIACSGGTAAPAPPQPASGVTLNTVAGGVDAKPGDGSQNGDSTNPPAPGASPASDQQLIVYTGTLDLQVTDLRAAVDQADQLVAGLGGHVSASDTTTKDDQQFATVTYRIPAEKWDEALAGLRAVGAKVLNETTKSEDVTGQVVDLDARIANAQASETALQAIMDRATTIQDVLDVQRELTSVRGDIESMTGQRDLLANRAALATLDVDFETQVAQSQVASTGWDLGQQVDGAVAALVRIGQGLVTLAIWALVVLVPIFVPLLIVLWIAIRLRRRWLRTHPRQAPTGTPAV